jgi:release factor glutamine methyltransferase
MTPVPSAPGTVGAALQRAKESLQSVESGPLVAEVLLARALATDRTWILAHPEQTLAPERTLVYDRLLARAAAGEPLAYLTGVQEFFGLEFEVSPGALIPRPETELLVETAMDWLEERGRDVSDAVPPICAVDLGTGSGCIAITLAVKTPGLRVIAVEISPAALAVAARNLARHAVGGRVRLVRADLLAPVRGPVDLLCANLPYAPAPTLEDSPVVRHEPRMAVDGGPDGLRLIARALAQAAPRMAPGGLALFEIDARHAAAARRAAREAFPSAAVKIKKDLAGLERLLLIRTAPADNPKGPDL